MRTAAINALGRNTAHFYRMLLAALVLVAPIHVHAQANVFFSNADVRCVAVTNGPAATTTSHADVMARHEAASAAVVFALADANAGNVGAGRRALAGKTVEVTFADGGRENWILNPNYLMSFVLLEQPVPNSLRLGDGVAKTRTAPCVPIPGRSFMDLPDPSGTMSVSMTGYWEYRAGYTYVDGVGGFANGEWVFVITGIEFNYLSQTANAW
jgi:hypothetical protein